MSAMPTDRFSRCPEMYNITYRAITANKRSKILYSVLFGLSKIDCLPGVFRFIIFLMSHGIPKDMSIAKEFAPSEFETPTPPSFFRIIKTLDMPSGIHPPAAKNVSPITASGIWNVKPVKNTIQTI